MHALKRTRLVWLAAATLVLALAGCGGSSDDEKEPEPPAPPAPKIEPAVTQPGTPNGDPASASLNNAGGSLTSPDGKLTITVPEGALSEPTTLSIQPITNGAPGSHGPAYRLLPDGQAFAKPITLTFHYTDDDVAGSAPQLLGIATHQSDGTWQAIGGPQIDEAARTVSISTSHFSDWSTFSGLKLFPTSGTVMVNKTKELSIRYCSAADDSYGVIPAGETGYLYNCDEVVDPDKTEAADKVLIPLVPVERDPRIKVVSWAANGVDGGNSTVGKVSAPGVYTAPASVPKSNPVAVSVKMRAPYITTDVLLVSNIKVVDDAVTYSGSISGTLHADDGEAIQEVSISANNIRLTRDELLPGDLSHYVLSNGTVTATSSMKFKDGTEMSGVSRNSTPDGAIMQIFDPVRPQGPNFAGRYWINVPGMGPEITGTPAGISVFGIGTSCPNSGADPAVHPLYGDDSSVIEGSFSATCSVGPITYDMQMQWSLQIDEKVE